MKRIGTYETLVVDRDEDIVQVTLNRPDRLNAINDQMFVDMPDAIGRVATDDTVRAVILTGAGRGFCSGREVSEIARRSGEGERLAIPEPAGRETTLLSGLQVPVIAAVNGAAAGAGLGLALMADFRIAAQSAVFVEAHVQRGLTPSVASWYLPRVVGLTKTFEIVLLGEKLSAQEALDCRLVNKVVPDGQVIEAAWALARRLAMLAPLTVRFAKETIYRGLMESLDSVRDMSGWSQVLGRLLTSEQRQASEAFLAKSAQASRP